MKRTLSTLAILLVAVTVQAQSLYFATDVGSGVGYVENAHIGVNWDVGNDFKFRVLTGFAQSQARGEYMDLGVALERVVPINLIPFGIEPVASADVRGYFGRFPSNTLGQGPHESESGIAYSLFTGLNYEALNIGVSFEQYPYQSSKVFINPVSVRLSF